MFSCVLEQSVPVTRFPGFGTNPNLNSSFWFELFALPLFLVTRWLLSGWFIRWTINRGSVAKQREISAASREEFKNAPITGDFGFVRKTQTTTEQSLFPRKPLGRMQNKWACVRNVPAGMNRAASNTDACLVGQLNLRRFNSLRFR